MKAFRYLGNSSIQIIQSEWYEATVEDFYVDIEERGKGVGKRLMRETCKDADREQVTLYLKPMPFSAYDAETETNYPPGLTYKQLCGFYRQFGFRFMPHSEIMKRVPKGE